MAESYHEIDRVGTRSAPDGEDRAAHREYMMQKAGGAMKFETLAKKVFGHKPTATVVRQLLFWEGKGHDPEGYIYKTYKEWWDEEGLTRTELDTARYKLGPDKFGVLEEKRKGVPCKLYYRLDLGRLFEVMFPELEGPTAEDPVPEGETLNPSYRVQDSGSQECSQTAVKSAGKSPSLYREYTENTSEIPLTGGADAPHRGKEVEGLVRRLAAGLEADGHYLDADQEKKYAGNFGRLAKKADPAELEKVVGRIVSEWSRIQLSPQQALADLSGERNFAGDVAQPSPPEVVEAIKAHPYFGASGTVKGLAMWEVAEGWDFTNDQDPPMKVRLRISKSRQECDDFLPRLRSIARRAVRESAGDAPPPTPAARIASKGPREHATPPTTPDGPQAAEAIDRMLSDPASEVARIAHDAADETTVNTAARRRIEDVIGKELDVVGLYGSSDHIGASILASMTIRRAIERRSAITE